MPIAHVCQRCGQSTTRLFAQREPVYNLPIVRCLACGWACVRRPEPGAAAWRLVQRGSGAATLLLCKAGITAVLLGLTMGVMLAVAGMQDSIDQSPAEFWALTIVQFGVLPVVTGAWLTAAFWYLNRWRVFAVWILLLLAALAAAALVPDARVIQGVFDGPSETRLVLNWPRSMVTLLTGAILITWTFIAMLPGIPLGTVLGRVLLWMRFTRFRLRMHLRRRRRHT